MPTVDVAPPLDAVLMADGELADRVVADGVLADVALGGVALLAVLADTVPLVVATVR
jgi:hypothetical protein